MQARHDALAATGLWLLADEFQEAGCIPQAVKCLEAICQSDVLFQPWIEAKTRLRVAQLLIEHCDNTKAAQSHLERALLVMKRVPACLGLKCSIIGMLSHCYGLSQARHLQKQMLMRGLEMTKGNLQAEGGLVWMCNFALHLGGAHMGEGEWDDAVVIFKMGNDLGNEFERRDLQLMFSVTILHALLIKDSPANVVASSIRDCSVIAALLAPDQRQSSIGLLVYSELLQAMWLLHVCDYKSLKAHVQSLETWIGSSPTVNGLHQQSAEQPFQLSLCQRTGSVSDISSFPDHLRAVCSKSGRLRLGPPPLDAEWLPLTAVSIVVDLLALACLRPDGDKGRIMARQSVCLTRIQGELRRLHVSDDSTETSLQQWAMEDVTMYLQLFFHLLEYRALVELQRTMWLQAQQTIAQIVGLIARFPTLLAGWASELHTLLGLYAHCLGNFQEAVLHFIKAKAVASNEVEMMLSDIFAAVSCLSLGTTDALSRALDHIKPVYGQTESLQQPRVLAGALLGMGLFRFQQGEFLDARVRFGSGMKVAHERLGSHHLLAQILVPVGALARHMNDMQQAKEVLNSALVTARSSDSLHAQLSSLRELEEVYAALGDSGKLLQTQTSVRRKSHQLEQVRQAVSSSPLHSQLLQYGLQ